MRTLRHRTSKKEARATCPMARQRGPPRSRLGLHGETRVNAARAVGASDIQSVQTGIGMRNVV